MSTSRARMMAARRQIVRTFKKHQLTLQLDATEYLEETLESQNVPPEDLNDTLENIAAGYVAREGLNLVSRARLEVVLESMQKWTHHLHEKPTRNPLDPHKSQMTASQVNTHSQLQRPDPRDLESIDMASMRHRIQEMEGEEEQQHESNSHDQDYLMDHEAVQSYDTNEEVEDDLDITEMFHVIDAFSMPRWAWASDIKTFVRTDPSQRQHDTEHGHENRANGSMNSAANMSNHVLGTAEEKTAMFRARYQVLLQRIMRNECFAPPVFTGGMQQDRYLKLTPLKALKGRCGERFLMFGMLVQMGDGKFCLEDADDRIELVLDNSKNSAGLFTENCFVLVEGLYTDDNVILVDTIGLPPPELREETKKVFGNIDFLGAPKEMRSEDQLSVIAGEYPNIMFVILSDLWLDQPKTFTTLRTIFDGYSSANIPLAFIMCGSFKSQPFLFNGLESGQYRDGFNALAELIAEFDELARSSYFVFVPGPNDPWGGSILPRPKIPDFYTAKMRSLVKRSVFASNPCRIKYCNQEIVIFREDILNRLLRNCIVPPVGDVVIQKQLIRTIVDGAHLCPLPLTTRQVSWAHDHALRIYPIPDALILADKFEAYSFKYQNCHCMNPGSFPTSDYSWMVYYPASRESDICQIPK
ncbi:DNA polymerase alpha/epsilon subunit B-domain-containing protein [Gamsiella multidivaricata]|uniref:DNA polymerase alpha/epsilon subunit B-domain-containing protein n=1 Tax=Gamsiella multidivaricata TaxID=101098 RepID=UPI00221FCA57|nr:DNA polymerase alpha/epsilon subunit B-domain-containing protein [Gamsiella multidivaricata]KAI7830646.1 DNA polymerase alpha/epsilon subunit B-domain-containing protein [Gamsiella multidivaricata]